MMIFTFLVLSLPLCTVAFALLFCARLVSVAMNPPPDVLPVKNEDARNDSGNRARG